MADDYSSWKDYIEGASKPITLTRENLAAAAKAMTEGFPRPQVRFIQDVLAEEAHLGLMFFGQAYYEKVRSVAQQYQKRPYGKKYTIAAVERLLGMIRKRWPTHG